jgi:hypothetical protein
MSSLESTEQHVARRLELITNWLALLALLGSGIVWMPGDERAGTPASSGATQHARVYAPQAEPPPSNQPQQHPQSRASRACRQS